MSELNSILLSDKFVLAPLDKANEIIKDLIHDGINKVTLDDGTFLLTEFLNWVEHL